VSFNTIKAIYDSYDVAQICTRHLINDVRSLDYQWVPPANVAEDATDDIEAAERFFSCPDRRQPFRAWLAEYLQDVLRYDAGTLFIRRDEADRPIALEVVSGASMIPLVDFFGRLPMDDPTPEVTDRIRELGGTWDGGVVPSFVQIIEGMPWVWMAADDVVYQPWNPMPDSQYGLAPLEAVLLTANTDIRFQWHFLQYFTEGTIPAGFMEAPPDLSDPAQIAEWQSTWDALMLGDQSKLRQIRWVPSGAKFQAIKDAPFDSSFPLYLMRRVAASFGVTPNDLGFTEDVNRSTGDTQIDVQFRVGTLPLIRHCEDVINLFVTEHLRLKARIQFDTGREVEDRLASAQADEIHWKIGAISSDEIRFKLGKRISKERPTPRVVDNTRAGPIPLLAIESLAGKIDPTTFGPAKGQQLIDHPFVSAPGVAPVIGSSSYQAAQNSTEAMQVNMIAQNDDPRAAGRVLNPDGSTDAGPVLPEPLGAPGTEGEAAKALSDALGIIDVLLNRLAAKEATAGLTAATGVQGSDLIGDEDDDETVVKVLRQWRENSRNRVRKGQAPRRFDDAPAPVADRVWSTLETARTREEVDAAFAAVGKAAAPDGA
jgi:hypothetical protein